MSTSSFMRHDTILNRDRSVVLLVDVQERFRDVMADGPAMIEECGRILQAAKILGIPILATEQYPKGLGHTVPELAELIDGYPLVEKLTFSCCGESGLMEQLEVLDRDQIVVIGIESHVCVLQTALDLLAAAKQVHVPHDAITSRSRKMRASAIERMRQAGVVITCAESVLFEWLVEASGDEFKPVSKLVKRKIEE